VRIAPGHGRSLGDGGRPLDLGVDPVVSERAAPGDAVDSEHALSGATGTGLPEVVVPSLNTTMPAVLGVMVARSLVRNRSGRTAT
jgi:hypothetical protein